MKCPPDDVHMTRSMRWIGTELCNLPRYDGLSDISMFVKTFELQVPEQQRLLALDVVLKVTPTRWWVAHREGMKDWLQCNRLMQIRFGTEGENIAHKYTGESDPAGHVEQCRDLWGSVPETEWTHIFIHTLGTILKNWYLELEMRRETTRWEELIQRFKIMFTFEHESPSIDATLQAIQTKIFSEEETMEVIPVCSEHKNKMIVHKLLECYNVAKEEYDEEDPRNVQILRQKENEP
jgi:hypothetical protein